MAVTDLGGNGKSVSVQAASSGNNTIVPAVTLNKILVKGCVLIATGAVTITFQDGTTGGLLTGAIDLVAGGGFVLPYSEKGWFMTSKNTLLNLVLSGAVKVSGVLIYDEV